MFRPLKKRLFIWGGLTALVLGVAALLLYSTFREPKYSGRPLSEWTAMLSSSKPEERQQAEQVLRGLGPDAVSELSEQVKRKSQVLGRLRDVAEKIVPDRVKPKLRRYFGKGKEVNSRYAATQALRLMGTNAHLAAPALAQALQDPNVLISSAAGQALGQIGPEAVPYLVEALNNPDYLVRANACSALAQLGTNSAPAVPKLTEFIRDETGPIVSSAAYTLSRIGAPIIPSVIPLLSSTNWTIRRWAVYSLAFAGPTVMEAMPQVIPMLLDTNEQVRWITVTAIGKIDVTSKAAGEALLYATRDSSSNVQVAAISELAFRPDIVIAEMPRFLQMLKDPSPAIRGQAAYALGQTGRFASNAVPVLKELLADPDQDVQSRAKKAIETIEASIAAG